MLQTKLRLLPSMGRRSHTKRACVRVRVRACVRVRARRVLCACVRAFACTKRIARALQVVTAMGADAWGDWEAAKFAPEEKFLEKIKAISGISQVSHYRKSSRFL